MLVISMENLLQKVCSHSDKKRVDKFFEAVRLFYPGVKVAFLASKELEKEVLDNSVDGFADGVAMVGCRCPDSISGFLTENVAIIRDVLGSDLSVLDGIEKIDFLDVENISLQCENRAEKLQMKYAMNRKCHFNKGYLYCYCDDHPHCLRFSII